MRLQGKDAFDKWQEYGVDFQSRRIMLDAGLDEDSTGRCVANLLWMDKEPGPIELLINSPGGWVSSMWAIYDIMRSANNPIITVGLGEVSSAAVLILAAGTGTRYVTQNTQLMHHQVQHFREANHRELMDYAAASDKDEEVRLRLLAQHTKTAYRTWKNKSTGEWYMRGAEMIEAGIADELWTGPNHEETS